MITIVFLLYLCKASLCLSVLYLLYYMFLKNETLYTGNRFYLLSVLIVSFVIPLVSFNTMSLPEAVPFSGALNTGFGELHSLQEVAVKSTNYNYLDIYSIISIIYIIVCSVLLLRILFQLLKIARIIRLGTIENIFGYKIVNVDFKQTPFSFFNWIVINCNNHTSENLKRIIDHENMHIRSVHSIDILLSEIACAVLWFNPIVFMFKKSLTENNEFMADKKTISLGHFAADYMRTIIQETCSNSVTPLVNSFCSTTKKRVIMMTKEKSNKKRSIKYLLTLPVLSVLLFAFTNRTIENSSNDIVNISIANEIDNSIPNIKPLDKMDEISSHFGEMINPITKKKVNHTGIDVPAKEGTPIYATGSGVVKKAKASKKGWGTFISVVHNQHYQTNYAHLSKLNVKEGDKVTKGDIIGYVGNTGMSTGPHLHYEIIKDKKAVDPMLIMK